MGIKRSITVNQSSRWTLTEPLVTFMDISFGSPRPGMDGLCLIPVRLILGFRCTSSCRLASQHTGNASWHIDRVVSKEVCLPTQELLDLLDISARSSEQRFGSALLDLIYDWTTSTQTPVTGSVGTISSMMASCGGRTNTVTWPKGSERIVLWRFWMMSLRLSARLKRLGLPTSTSETNRTIFGKMLSVGPIAES